MNEDHHIQSDSPSISWPINRPVQQNFSTTRSVQLTASDSGAWLEQSSKSKSDGNNFVKEDIFPGNKKALDGIALRAFLLGTSLGVFTLTTILLAFYHYPIWRAPFFLASLSLFHFCEYYITAAYNTPAANISAFLLSQNGKAYNMAHTAALTECVLASMFFPKWQISISSPLLSVGFASMILGQVIRSIAMAHAGTNFNHTVQTRKATGHELVTDGIYRYLRHPSYFGFFWWGLGTQVVLGNIVCFIAYTIILWSFFNNRIRKEEELLVMFFGVSYERYRARVRVGIPFIS